jgi:hypothetical protein
LPHNTTKAPFFIDHDSRQGPSRDQATIHLFVTVPVFPPSTPRPGQSLRFSPSSFPRVRRHSVLPSSIPFILLRGVPLLFRKRPPPRCDSTSPFFHEATDRVETTIFFTIQFDSNELHSFKSLAGFYSRSMPVTWRNCISGTTGFTSSIV